MIADIEFKKVAARAALIEAGVPKERLTRTLRLLDFDALDLVDGELSGIGEQLTELSNELPEIFGAPEPEGPEEVDLSRLTETERQAISMLGSGGRQQVEDILNKYRSVPYDPAQGWEENDDAEVMRHLTPTQQQSLMFVRSSGEHEQARQLIDKAEQAADPATKELMRQLRPTA